MKSFVTLLVALCLSGCAASYQPPSSYNVEKERIIAKPYDAVWNRAIEWFALNGSPVKNTDKQSGLIVSDLALTKSPQYCDCGKGVAGAYKTIAVVNRVGNFNLLFRKVDENNTKVTVICAFHARVEDQGEYSTSYKDIDCNSKGVLEGQILDYLAENQ